MKEITRKNTMSEMKTARDVTGFSDKAGVRIQQIMKRGVGPFLMSHGRTFRLMTSLFIRV
jgi:hypothetical protein